MKISLLATCLVDALEPEVGLATARLLSRLGHEVELPSSQVCCGQMHINTGYFREAIPVIENQVAAFAEADVVVAPSSSCVGTVRHQQAMVAQRHGSAQLVEDVKSLQARTYELSELLIDVLGVVDVGAWFPHRVTLHPTCHSLRLLQTTERHRRLLSAVADITVVELARPDVCCGFGGTFALKNSAVSSAMLADKVADVCASGAEVCTTGDSSCLMQIDGGLRRAKAPVRTAHLAEILASTRELPWAG